MPTDIVLQEQDLILDGADARIHLKAADVSLASSGRQKTAGLRRALVHSEDDELVLNFGGDYPGGVHVHGALRVGLPKPKPAPAPDDYTLVPAGGLDVDLGDGDPAHLQDPNLVFGDLDHPLPLDVVEELRILRWAVRRLHERVTELEAKP
jgi:hypothetical protein